jgi:hypothetical protein
MRFAVDMCGPASLNTAQGDDLRQVIVDRLYEDALAEPVEKQAVFFLAKSFFAHGVLKTELDDHVINPYPVFLDYIEIQGGPVVIVAVENAYIRINACFD